MLFFNVIFFQGVCDHSTPQLLFLWYQWMIFRSIFQNNKVLLFYYKVTIFNVSHSGCRWWWLSTDYFYLLLTFIFSLLSMNCHDLLGKMYFRLPSLWFWFQSCRSFRLITTQDKRGNLALFTLLREKKWIHTFPKCTWEKVNARDWSKIWNRLVDFPFSRR